MSVSCGLRTSCSGTCCISSTYQASYSVDDSGNVTLGDSSPVQVEFTPASTTESVINDDHRGGLWLLEAVDSKSGTEWDVMLIESGMSKNKVRYKPNVLREAAPLYEGSAA